MKRLSKKSFIFSFDAKSNSCRIKSETKHHYSRLTSTLTWNSVNRMIGICRELRSFFRLWQLIVARWKGAVADFLGEMTFLKKCCRKIYIGYKTLWKLLTEMFVASRLRHLCLITVCLRGWTPDPKAMINNQH